jgi:tetratricopeptide (TPR) repeat protein/predicted Ser/Thr protein kinase
VACPPEQLIVACADGSLPAPARADVEEHVTGCADCQRRLTDALASRSRTVAARGNLEARTPTGGAHAPPPAPEALPRGASVGRYTILALVARGGMGEVYAAYDPELDRKIALKLLQTTPGAVDARAQARLLREAKAIAKVSHPNVIVVHDAGTFADRVFVAMEFVDGQTLKAWLAETPRTRREILDVFTGAARGLDAAHAAGLVHRDFKPHNVMVGKDGSVRVMDFGLARPISDAASAPADPAPDDDAAIIAATTSARSAPDHDLTRTGELVGTPLYMAPEQFLTVATDARTDQFSFCVALYQALYRDHPFAGDSMPVLITNVLGGHVHPPPARHDVPGWLRRVLLRGLAVDPGARWPSMQALIGALAQDPARVRRRFAAGAGVALLLLATVGTLVRGARPSAALCRGGPAHLRGVWEPADATDAAGARRATIHAAFLRAGSSGAADAWARVEPVLDRYAARWLGMYRQACEATQLRGEQSAETLDLRMSCLEQRRNALLALSDVLATADQVAVSVAVNAANALPAIESCADMNLLRAAVAPPPDQATRAKIEDLRRRAAIAKALNDTGKHPLALQRSAALIDEARAIGYRPLLADLLFMAGEFDNGANFRPEAVPLLEEALWTGLASRRDDVAVEAAALLTGYVGTYLARPADGRRWARLAESVLDRLGEGHDRLRAWVLQAEALIDIQEGKLAHALELVTRGLALKEKALPADHPDIAISLEVQADVLHGLGRNDEALRASERAAAMTLRAFGPGSPALNVILNNRGEYLVDMGRSAEALPVLRESLAGWEAQGLPDNATLSYPLTNLGQALLGVGRAAEAVAPLERALRARAAGEIDPLLLADTRFALGRALWEAGPSPARAVTLIMDARAAYQAARSPRGTAQTAAIDKWLAAHPGAEKVGPTYGKMPPARAR